MKTLTAMFFIFAIIMVASALPVDSLKARPDSVKVKVDSLNASSVKTDSSDSKSNLPMEKSVSDSIQKPASDTSKQALLPCKMDISGQETRNYRKALTKDKKAPKEEETDVIRTYKGNVNQLKSPKKAFFLSFLFPGLGEYYAHGGIIRVGIPVAIELGSYASAFIFKSKYNDLTTKYQRHADAHFSHDRFYSWHHKVLSDSGNIVVPDSMGEVSLYLNVYSRKTNDYYEMISKYDVFTQGWEDAYPNMIDSNYKYMSRTPNLGSNPQRYRAYAIDSVREANGVVTDTFWTAYHDPGTNKRPFLHGKSQYQLTNMDMRTTANEMGDNIKYAFYAMIINRIVSSIDAVLAATSYNRMLTGGSLTYMDKVRFQPVKVGVSELYANGVSVSYQF